MHLLGNSIPRQLAPQLHGMHHLYEYKGQGQRCGRGHVHACLQGMQRPVPVALQQPSIRSLLFLQLLHHSA